MSPSVQDAIHRNLVSVKFGTLSRLAVDASIHLDAMLLAIGNRDYDRFSPAVERFITSARAVVELSKDVQRTIEGGSEKD